MLLSLTHSFVSLFPGFLYRQLMSQVPLKMIAATKLPSKKIMVLEEEEELYFKTSKYAVEDRVGDKFDHDIYCVPS